MDNCCSLRASERHLRCFPIKRKPFLIAEKLCFLFRPLGVEVEQNCRLGNADKWKNRSGSHYKIVMPWSILWSSQWLRAYAGSGDGLHIKGLLTMEGFKARLRRSSSIRRFLRKIPRESYKEYYGQGVFGCVFWPFKFARIQLLGSNCDGKNRKPENFQRMLVKVWMVRAFRKRYSVPENYRRDEKLHKST